MGKSNCNSFPLRAARAQISSPETTIRAMYRSAIGIDVHLNLLVCCHQVQLEGGHEEKCEHRDFLTDRKGLDELTEWCKECRPDIILMESTGVLWYSPYEALEDAGFGFEQLALINARDAKAAAGRKTDRKDASRLATLARSGHFRKSFVPPRDFREQRFIARDLQKNRSDLVRAINRFQKLLNATGCRASTVFSDVCGGKAASIILDAKLRDDPNLEQIVRANCRRLRASPEQIMSALDFPISAPIIGQLRAVRRKIDQLEEYDRETFDRLRALQKPYQHDIDLLITITGLQERSARMIYAELCCDLRAYFSDSEKFASWMGICPGDNTSAGKQKSGSCPKGNKNLRRTLVEATRGLIAGGTAAIKDKFLSYKMRRGHRRAIVAMAHLLARIVYSVLTNKKPYVVQQTTALRDTVVERAKRSLAQLMKRKDVMFVDGLVVEKETGAILASVNVDS